MNNRASRLRWLSNAVAFVLLGVGLYVVLRWLAQLAALLLSHVSFASYWQHGASFLREDGALWISAIATLMLFVATRTLYRLTNIQLAIDGPVLVVNLTKMAPEPPINVSAYFQEWIEQDQGHAQLAPHLQGAPNYIYLMILNTQNKRTAVAGGIEVTVALFFGSPTGMIPHPHVQRRVARSEVIAPETFVVGPVLNTGDLDAYLAVVESVEYRDVSGRRRTAAWGTNIILRNPGAAPVLGNKIFEPRKGEYSDGHR